MMVAIAKLAALSVSLALLGGCVAFEHAPAALECDPTLAGHWQPSDGSALAVGAHVEIDEECEARVSNATSGLDAPLGVRGFRLDGQRYLALDARQMQDIMEPGSVARGESYFPGIGEQAVFLLQYRIQGDTLSASLVDTERLDALLDQETPGIKRLDPQSYLLSGTTDELQRLLSRKPSLFAPLDSPGKQLRLQRAPAEKPR